MRILSIIDRILIQFFEDENGLIHKVKSPLRKKITMCSLVFLCSFQASHYLKRQQQKDSYVICRQGTPVSNDYNYFFFYNFYNNSKKEEEKFDGCPVACCC